MIEATLQPQDTVLGEGFSLGTRPLRRFSVEEYHALATAGVLTAQDRVELLDGLIVNMSPIGPTHAYCVEHTDRRVLGPLLPDGWHLRMQQPITLATSEPQPDVAVIRDPPEEYLARHPRPEDVGLLIEVADTTLVDDRKKAAIYAAAAIQQYWIIDLVHETLEVYRNPRASRAKGAATYRYKRVLDKSSEVSLALGGEPIGKVPVAALFPYS